MKIVFFMERLYVCVLLFVLVLGFVLAENDVTNSDFSYNADTGEVTYGGVVYTYDDLNESLLEMLEDFLKRLDYDGNSNGVSEDRRVFVEEAKRVGERYRSDINEVRGGFREDREEFARRRQEIIYEINEGNLTRDEKISLIEELSGVKTDFKNDVKSYVDEKKNLRVEYRGELLNLSRQVNGTFLRHRFRMKNGEDFEIKVDPSDIIDKVVTRLKLRGCNESNDCSIDLKEVVKRRVHRVAYHLKAKQRGRFLGMFKTKLNIEAEVDAETGEVIETTKPWWSFLVTED